MAYHHNALIEKVVALVTFLVVHFRFFQILRVFAFLVYLGDNMNAERNGARLRVIEYELLAKA